MFLFLSPLTFFGLPLFLFLFLCLSLSLSLFLLSFFLPSCLSFCFLFVSCFCLFFIFLSSLLLFHEKNNMKMFNCNLSFPEIFSLSFRFLSCFFFPIPFSYPCFFLIFSYVFCSTSMFLVSKKTKLKKTPIFGQKGSCNKTVFLMNLSFGQCEKLSFFLAHFFAKFWLMLKLTL